MSVMNDHELFRTPLSMREAIAKAQARTFAGYQPDSTTRAVFEAGWRAAYLHMAASLKEVA